MRLQGKPDSRVSDRLQRTTGFGIGEDDCTHKNPIEAPIRKYHFWPEVRGDFKEGWLSRLSDCPSSDVCVDDCHSQ